MYVSNSKLLSCREKAEKFVLVGLVLKSTSLTSTLRQRGHSRQPLLNKFFGPTTPSMRKGCDGKNYQNTSLAAKGALAHCLQRRTACKIQNGR